MPIPPETERNLNDINWALAWFDFALGVISSNLERFPPLMTHQAFTLTG